MELFKIGRCSRKVFLYAIVSMLVLVLLYRDVTRNQNRNQNAIITEERHVEGGIQEIEYREAEADPDEPLDGSVEEEEEEEDSQPAGANKPGNNNAPGPPPCGEVCSYKGTPIVGGNNSLYPALSKNFQCRNILGRMAFRGWNITHPPPVMPPDDMRQEFEQYGDSRISSKQYMVGFEAGHTDKGLYYSRARIHSYIEKASQGINVNIYKDDRGMVDLLDKYKKHISGTNALVVGTRTPWIEAVLVLHGARNVTTLDYVRLRLDHPQMTFYTPYTFAEQFLEGKIEQISFAASFSSIEHSGLGRYGDPLNPYGDFEALAQAWCMMEPGGIYVLGVPGMSSDKSFIVWNAHRVYGTKRVQYLISNWEILERRIAANKHLIMVLRKPV